MNFSAGLSLYKLCSKKFGLSIWVSYLFIDTNYNFLKLYNTHTGKPLVGISATGMESMFSEYILGQYLTPISDAISWVVEEHEIMSDKEFFFTGCVSDWSIQNND